MDQQGLGETGHADDQAVAAGHYGNQHLLDDALLADDQLCQFLAGPPAARAQIVGESDVVFSLQACRLFCFGIHVRVPRSC